MLDNPETGGYFQWAAPATRHQGLEVAVPRRELTHITFTARYQLSPRIKTLNAIFAKLRLKPIPEPAPPTKE